MHLFFFYLKKKKWKRRGRGVKGKGVTNCWDFRGNFIIVLGNFMGIWPFSNSQNSQLFLRIPQKSLGFLTISRQVQFVRSYFFPATSPNSDWCVDLIGQRPFLEVGDSQVQSEKSRLF